MSEHVEWTSSAKHPFNMCSGLLGREKDVFHLTLILCGKQLKHHSLQDFRICNTLNMFLRQRSHLWKMQLNNGYEHLPLVFQALLPLLKNSFLATFLTTFLATFLHNLLIGPGIVENIS